MILRGNFFSQKLEMETSITIVAPNKFYSQPYKVVYLLHGLCGRSGDWVLRDKRICIIGQQKEGKNISGMLDI